MDNDNKINLPSVNDVHKEVSLLLENELSKISKNEEKEFFSLEEEFASTKKNMFSFLWENMLLRLVLCFGVVLAITVVLLVFVSNANRKLTIDINEFEALNLSNLLEKVSNIDKKIQEAESTKQNLVEKRNSEIERVEGNHTAALKNLASMNIKNKSARRLQAEKIEDEYRAELASIEKYNKLIENCNSDIKMYTEQRNEFDSGRVQEAEKQKAIINSERFLHEKEKEKIVGDYENRLEESREELKKTQAEDLKRQEELLAFTINQYDPQIPRDGETKKILNGAKDLQSSYTGAVYEGNEIFISEKASEEFKTIFEKQKKNFDSLEKLYSFLSQTPHKEGNAVQSFLRAIKRYSCSAANEISVLSVTEVNRWIAEKSEVESELGGIKKEYGEFLETVCEENLGKAEVDGIVISVSEDGVPKFYIKNFSRGKFENPEAKGFAFSCTIYRGKEKVAVGEIEKKEGEIFLQNLSFGAGLKIRAGDKIVIGELIKS